MIISCLIVIKSPKIKNIFTILLFAKIIFKVHKKTLERLARFPLHKMKTIFYNLFSKKIFSNGIDRGFPPTE